MQSKKLSLIIISILGLSACESTADFLIGSQMQTEYLKNDLGILTECRTALDWTTGKPDSSPIIKSWANAFWRDNNLPKGTLYYVCDKDKGLLPKDCQGKSLTTPQIRRYWKKYNLPVGTTEFDCSSGVPKVIKGR